MRFILLTGDQIYADAYEHNGIGKIACDLREYREVYTYTWSRSPLRQLLANLPAFMTLDDHEVDDDWRWLDKERNWAYIPWWNQFQRWMKGRPPQERYIPRKRVQDALQAYWEHQGMHAPHFELPPSVDQAGQYVLAASDLGSLAYTFTYGCAAFFVLDTRTMRVRSRGISSMLGEAQWQALESWLVAVKDAYPVKFLVSSCALLFQMWLDLPRDRWSGFPKERQRLLELLANHLSDGIYVLAGDLHSAYAVSAELCGPQGRVMPIWEFCSSPFEQEPNLFYRRTYYPIRSRLVKKQKLHFSLAQNNFGVVQVNYPAGSRPFVKFRLFDGAGEMLAEVVS